MIERIREVEASLGSSRKEPVAQEAAVAAVARKSLVAAKSISAGTILEAHMIAVKRPGTGLAPDELGTLVGKTARIDIAEGTLFSHEMLG